MRQNDQRHDIAPGDLFYSEYWATVSVVISSGELSLELCAIDDVVVLNHREGSPIGDLICGEETQREAACATR